jgi:hypothetical protein
MGHPPWREDGSVVYNCYWSLPAQPFSGQSPEAPMTIFYCLRFETSPNWRARSPYLYPQGRGGPVIPPGSGFPFCCLLRLARQRWRYSNPPPHWIDYVKSKSYFTTGCLPQISSSWRQAPWDPRPETFSTEPCDNSPYVTSALTRGGFVSHEYACALSSVHIAHVESDWKFFLLHCVKALYQSRLCKAEHACLRFYATTAA